MTPTPRTLYVHDDLTDDVAERHGAGSEPARLARELLALVGRDARRVRILTLEEQLTALAAARHPPFALAVGIGRAGERVARQVHARTAWFPRIGRVDVAREEVGDGYALSTLGKPPLEAQLVAALGRQPAGTAPVAVVDDTVFSGLTMRAVLGALPPAALARAHAFCLRAVADSLARVAKLCPVDAGFVAHGRLLDDVSFINASGLVRRGAIRRAGQPPLAFYERSEWMSAWFGPDAAEVTARCAALARLLDGAA
jgi:pyrimidine operon attenuation protein/uracil phosphoribosyltransferase